MVLNLSLEFTWLLKLLTAFFTKSAMAFKEMTGCMSLFISINSAANRVCMRARNTWKLSHLTPNSAHLNAYTGLPTWISLLHLGLPCVCILNTRATYFLLHPLSPIHSKVIDWQLIISKTKYQALNIKILSTHCLHS